MNYLKSQFILLLIGMALCGLVFIGCDGNSAQVLDKTEVAIAPAATVPVSKDDKKAKPVINKDGKVPKLVFRELTHDFGKQVSGPDLVHSFIFENKGGGILFIEKVKAG
ncbi:DUF1573 domain-containing protein [bacterium]|nr:DUF1573 domain-containing protein [bacterium]